MTGRIFPYMKRMYDAENQYRVYAEIPESIHTVFKHALFDRGVSQKKAVAEAIQLWIDNQNALSLTCTVCNRPVEYTGFPVLSDSSFEDAVISLKRNMICNDPECTIMFEKDHDVDNYNKLKEQFGTDKWDFCDAIWKSWGNKK